MHPGHDDYIDEHSSLLTLHEFENPVIISVHFLYCGSTTNRYSIRGGLKEQRIQFHVVEQTVFYHLPTSQPFKTLTKPDSLEYYIRRATTPLNHRVRFPTRVRVPYHSDMSMSGKHTHQASVGCQEDLLW